MRYKINTYSVITFLFFAGFISAQDTDQSSILITTSSETQIPADDIFFSITLSTQNEDPKKAFDEQGIEIPFPHRIVYLKEEKKL